MTSPARWTWRSGVRALPVGVIPLLLGACAAQRSIGVDNGSPPPFVFRSLDLRQQDLLGRPTWRLSSPEARYDIRRRVAQAEKPKGMIFRDGKPAYRLSATSGTVINDGQVVLLEGHIRVEQLGESPLLILAERARWLPGRNRLEIDRRPEALDRSHRLTSRRARFQFDTNKLSLREQPRLEHWSRPFPSFRDTRRSAPEVVLNVREADWFPISGTLRASGPVKAIRQVPGRASGLPPQTLSASAIDGNTRNQEYWLRAPVLFRDPADNASLDALDVRLDVRDRRLNSESPFQGRRGELQVSGQRFAIYEGQQLISIPVGCHLLQGGDSVQASECSWNWDHQEVLAQGGVELRRQANRQFSRGDLLQGRLGPDGELTLSNPGGRVLSRFQVPSRPAPPRPAQPRPAPEPIRL